MYEKEEERRKSEIRLFSDQARSQGGFEGVRTNPPCSLAKFIFNETAVVSFPDPPRREEGSGK